MMQSNQPLFQLDVFHAYFQDDVCRCLEFNVEAATERLMKRFRLMIRRQVNGFGLYADAQQPIAQLFAYIEQATGHDSFQFEIRTNDPNFNFFTALPLDWVGQLLYDSSNHNISNNKVQLAQVLSGNPGSSCLGKVRLRFQDILECSAQAGYAQFEIRYQARATQWQYFVVNRSLIALNNPAIQGKPPIVFEGPKHVYTPAGQQAMLFSSGNNLIPLNERALYKFDLVNHSVPSAGQETEGVQVVIKGLPNPAPQCICRAEGDVDAACSSPMYVYL